MGSGLGAPQIDEASAMMTDDHEIGGLTRLRTSTVVIRCTIGLDNHGSQHRLDPDRLIMHAPCGSEEFSAVDEETSHCVQFLATQHVHRQELQSL